MNDFVLNLLPVGANRNIGKISSGMGMSVFNAPMFDSGAQIKVPTIPKLFGAPPNWGGGWASSGILGTYYSNNNFTGSSFQRSDIRIDMPLTTVLPGGSLSTDPVYGVIPATNFSVKWIGSLIPKYTENYTFKIKTGGTSLVLKISGTTLATATSASGWVTTNYSFISGTTYSVEVDYIQGTGPWGAQVHWLSTDVIPFPKEAISPAMPIGANRGSDENAPANALICANQYMANLSSGTGPAIDSSGWPTGDFAINQMSSPDIAAGPYAFPNVGFAGDAKTGVWTVSFNGAAELYTNNTGQFLIGHDDGLGRTLVTLNSLTYYSYGNTLPASALTWHLGTGTGYNPATNQTVALFDLRGGGWDNVGFSSTDRSGKGAPGGPSGSPGGNGLTNVVCMRPSSIGSTVPLPLGTVIYPPYLTTISQYTCARNNGRSYDLDYSGSVTSPYTDWNTRATPVFCSIASDPTQSGGNALLPWEHQVIAANIAGKDLYVNLPQSASGNVFDSDYASSYIYQLAYLIKNGGTINGVSYPGLLPHLCIYIEYGNENWNFTLAGPYGSRGDVTWAIHLGQVNNTNDWQQYSAMGGSVTYSPGPPPTTNGTATLWSVIKLKNTSDLFRMVFGDSAMPGGANGINYDPRVRPIFEWQYGGTYNGEGYSGDTALSTIQSYYGVTPNHVFWGGGGGWYATNSTSGSTPNQVFSNITLATAVPPGGSGSGNAGETNSIQADMDILSKYGFHHVGYEGGFEFGNGGGGANASVWQQCSNDSRIIPYVQQTVNQYFQAGGSLPVVFEAVSGPYGFEDEWAVIDGIWDQPPYATAPPKLQAYLNSVQSLPALVSAPPAWVTVPGYFPVQYGRQPGRPPYQTQTFVVNNPGIYSVGFETTTNGYTTTTTNFTIVIDGTVVLSGRTTLPNGGDSFWTPVYLGAGVHGYTVNVDSSAVVEFIPWGVI